MSSNKTRAGAVGLDIEAGRAVPSKRGAGEMNVRNKSLVMGRIVFAVLFSLTAVCVAWAQTAVEYGILGSKPTPTSGIGKTLEGRLKALSEQLQAPAVKQTPKPQGLQQQSKVFSSESAPPSGPNKFTIYSSEGVREVTIEQPNQDPKQDEQVTRE